MLAARFGSFRFGTFPQRPRLASKYAIRSVDGMRIVLGRASVGGVPALALRFQGKDLALSHHPTQLLVSEVA